METQLILFEGIASVINSYFLVPPISFHFMHVQVIEATKLFYLLTSNIKRYVCINTDLHISDEISALHLHLKCHWVPMVFHAIPT